MLNEKNKGAKKNKLHDSIYGKFKNGKPYCLGI